jgi:hypothetical protein
MLPNKITEKKQRKIFFFGFAFSGTQLLGLKCCRGPSFSLTKAKFHGLLYHYMYLPNQSSLGRYVFGSEISYNKPPPRLPGLGC